MPESGIRGRYAQFKTKLGRQVLEKIVGYKAFTKGPHGETLNLNSLTEFGHYNPNFLKKLKTQLKTLYGNKTFVEKFQDFYDRELQDYLRVHYQAYNFIKYNPEYKTDYLNHIEYYRKNPKLGERGYLLLMKCMIVFITLVSIWKMMVMMFMKHTPVLVFGLDVP